MQHCCSQPAGDDVLFHHRRQIHKQLWFNHAASVLDPANRDTCCSAEVRPSRRSHTTYAPSMSRLHGERYCTATSSAQQGCVACTESQQTNSPPALQLQQYTLHAKPHNKFEIPSLPHHSHHPVQTNQIIVGVTCHSTL